MRDIIRRAMRAVESKLGGHLTVGPLTVYGFNAMHGAINLRTRLGYVCLKLPSPGRGWYFYVSSNATPQAAWFAAGPGVYDEDKRRAWVRRTMARIWLDADNSQIDAIRRSDVHA